MKNLAVVVLAAGKGKRMNSDLAKVLHPILGRPLIEYLLDTLIGLKIDPIVIVIGFQADLVKEALADYSDRVKFALQEKQLGTGHATQMAEPELSGFKGDILVLAGDVPFLSPETIINLVDTHRTEQAAATVLSSFPPDATGYGRIIRQGLDNLVEKIVEHKDATEEERKIGEINTGTFCFKAADLFSALNRVKNDNSQGEYYLTDVMQILREQGKKAAVYRTDDAEEALGVNSSEQLAELEKRFAGRISSRG